MRNFINIITESSTPDRENDQQYLMDFYISCMRIAQSGGYSSAYGAKYFKALARFKKVDRLEAMFNEELLPFLAARGYPDEGSEGWAAAEQDVIMHFWSIKFGDRDVSDLHERARLPIEDAPPAELSSKTAKMIADDNVGNTRVLSKPDAAHLKQEEILAHFRKTLKDIRTKK